MGAGEGVGAGLGLPRRRGERAGSLGDGSGSLLPRLLRPRPGPARPRPGGRSRAAGRPRCRAPRCRPGAPSPGRQRLSRSGRPQAEAAPLPSGGDRAPVPPAATAPAASPLRGGSGDPPSPAALPAAGARGSPPPGEGSGGRAVRRRAPGLPASVGGCGAAGGGRRGGCGSLVGGQGRGKEAGRGGPPPGAGVGEEHPRNRRHGLSFRLYRDGKGRGRRGGRELEPSERARRLGPSSGAPQAGAQPRELLPQPGVHSPARAEAQGVPQAGAVGPPSKDLNVEAYDKEHKAAKRGSCESWLRFFKGCFISMIE